MTDHDSTATSELLGIEAVKAALGKNAPGSRSLGFLSVKLGLSRGAVVRWDKVPEKHLRDVARITGLPPRTIRPDLADLMLLERVE